MSEYLEKLNQKITEKFEGKVVRKDLVKLIKGNSTVQNFVLEYLLGQYCATNNPEDINAGVERVKDILAKHLIEKNEANRTQAYIAKLGTYRIIDKVNVDFDDKHNYFKATFANLDIKNVEISADDVYKYDKMLVSGIWCLVDLEHQPAENPNQSPWHIDSIRPIQLANFDFEEFINMRKEFTTDEWIDLLIQSIGFNPDELSRRKKMLQLVRLIPYCENNYNLIELGPKGTGKSHIYSDFSPHGILISGGEITLAKLFVNNSKKNDIGLVGYWDNIAFDEFAGRAKKADRALVDTMKNYMAQKTFSRGGKGGPQSASASFTFVGNTSHNVPYMLKHSHLFEELPAQYLDSAFIDRICFYIPGWEVDVTRDELYSRGFGFIIDYYAEALKSLRNYDYAGEYQADFTLSNDLKDRDRLGINKTFSGLMKIIYPDKKATVEEKEELLKFAIEGRKRIKNQILKIDTTAEKVNFNYTNKDGQVINVKTTEEIQYPHLCRDGVVQTVNEYSDSSNEQEESAPIAPNTVYNIPDNPNVSEMTDSVSVENTKELPAGHFSYEENQIGITFDKLFAPYLKGATEINIIDPYILSFYQLVNLMEFLEVVADVKEEDAIVNVNLSTAKDDYPLSKQDENLATIRESCFQLGIEFNYKFEDKIHDRSIETDNGWKIILGRGLDIFQSCERKDVFQFTTRQQQYRPCRNFGITYVKKED